MSGGGIHGWGAGDHRYGFVFRTTLALCILVLTLPSADWARGLTVLVAGANVLIIVATSRVARPTRRAGGAAVTAVVALGALLVAAGSVERPVAPAIIGGLSVIAIPATSSGLVRLIRARGVVAPAVLGALAIYVLIGLAFAFLYGFLATVVPGALFVDGTDGTTPDHAYFSFTALTTTGFGDLAVGARAARALAVLEMLVGQLYLVTIIALLVANLRPARSR